MNLADFTDPLLDLIFPNVCAGCNKYLAAKDHVLCITCITQLPLTNQFNTKDNDFERHFWGRLPLQSGAALMVYNPKELTQRVVHSFKYSNNRKVGQTFGAMIGDRIIASEYFRGIDVIVPVPLTRHRLYNRGYNQSLLLAHGISKSIQVPVAKQALIRIKDSPSQTSKSRIDRLLNMECAFQLKNKNDIKGKYVLLVDDVMTTGATLESCALEVLKSADRLSMVTIAIGR